MSDTPIPGPTETAYRAPRPKVPPFARYEGTSAWRKNRVRARAYARFKAAAKKAGEAGPAS